MKKDDLYLTLFLRLFLTFISLHTSQALFYNGYNILDLKTNNSDFISEAVLWKAPGVINENKIVFCGSHYYLGGSALFPNPGSSIRRTYTDLPSHASIRFVIWFKLVDIWTVGDNIDVMFDSINVGFQTIMPDFTAWATNVDECGNNDHDFDIKIFGRVQHSLSTLTIEIINRRVSSSSSGTFYFREVSLILHNDTLLTPPSEKSISSWPNGVNVVNVTTCGFHPYSYNITKCKNCNETSCNPWYDTAHTSICVETYLEIETTNCTNLGSCDTVHTTVPPYDLNCYLNHTGVPNPNNFSTDCYTEPTVNGVNPSDPPCNTTTTNYSSIIYYPNQAPCDYQQYFNTTNSTCEDCHSSCSYCFGGEDTDCYECIWPLFFDGTRCISCASECFLCHGSSTDECDLCEPPNYLLDNSCIPCDPPLIRIISGQFGYCIYPCKLNEYLYEDGTCYPTCDPRLIIDVQYGRNFCKLPCTAPNIMFYDGCNSPPCSYPLAIKKYGALPICEFPCPSGETLYYNNTCLPTPCSYPLESKPYYPRGTFYVCEPKCQAPTQYRHNNDSCLPTCPSPLNPTVLESADLCGPPMCGAVICDSCKTVPCKEAYGCNIDLGKFCIPYYTYGLQATNMKPALNGQVITVQVVPTQFGLTADSNDYLLFSIEGLRPNIDYSYGVIHLSVGVFQLNFTLLQPQDGVPLYGILHYSPYNIDLRGRFEIPRVTFISHLVQKTGESVGNASQVAFILFIISIFGMILNGGLTSLWTSLPDSQYTFYLIYLNVNYLYHTQTYFETLANYDLLSSPEREPIIIEDLKLKKSLPEKFYILSYQPDFLENSSQIFIQLLLMTIIVVVSFLLQRFIRFPRQLSFMHRVLDYSLGALKWNGILRQGMAYILPLSTASFIQLHASIFGSNSNKYSVLLSGGFLFILLCFFAIMRSLIRYSPLTKLEKVAHTKSFGTLWENLFTNSFGRYFFWLVALRGFILSYVVVFVTEYPYIQIIVLIVCQVFMVGIFIKGISIRYIFQDKWLNNMTFVEEVLILITKGFIFTFMIMQDIEATDKTLIILGWLIVVPGALSQALHVIYSVAVQVKNRKKHYDAIQLLFVKLSKKKIKKINRIPLKLRRVLQTDNDNDDLDED